MDTRVLNGKIYDNGPLGGTQIGRIANGRIYEGTWMGGNEIGRIKENGDIVIHGDIVGRINDDNEIYQGTWMGGNSVGRITSEGEIRCGFWMGGNYAGRIVFDERSQVLDSTYKGVEGTGVSGVEFLFCLIGTVIGMIWGFSWDGALGIFGFFIGGAIGAPIGLVMWKLISSFLNGRGQ